MSAAKLVGALITAYWVWEILVAFFGYLDDRRKPKPREVLSAEASRRRLLGY